MRNASSNINKTFNKKLKKNGVKNGRKRGFTESHASLDNSNNSSLKTRIPTKLSLYQMKFQGDNDKIKENKIKQQKFQKIFEASIDGVDHNASTKEVNIELTKQNPCDRAQTLEKLIKNRLKQLNQAIFQVKAKDSQRDESVKSLNKEKTKSPIIPSYKIKFQRNTTTTTATGTTSKTTVTPHGKNSPIMRNQAHFSNKLIPKKQANIEYLKQTTDLEEEQANKVEEQMLEEDSQKIDFNQVGIEFKYDVHKLFEEYTSQLIISDEQQNINNQSLKAHRKSVLSRQRHKIITGQDVVSSDLDEHNSEKYSINVSDPLHNQIRFPFKNAKVYENLNSTGQTINNNE